MSKAPQASQPIGGSVTVTFEIPCSICGKVALHFLTSPNDSKPFPVCRHHFWFLVGTLRSGDRCTAITIYVDRGNSGERDSTIKR